MSEIPSEAPRNQKTATGTAVAFALPTRRAGVRASGVGHKPFGSALLPVSAASARRNARDELRDAGAEAVGSAPSTEDAPRLVAAVAALASAVA